MYDPAGANSGHQWLELTNMGEAPIDLSGWRVSEGGTNHKLSVINGTTTLAAGASLIVASNSDDFAADFPNYAGALLKSALSLPSKNGGTVALKDGKLNTIDSITYAPSAGASGDGNTLHRTGSSLVAGAPDPGTYAAQPPAPLTKKAASGTSATSRALPAPKAVRAAPSTAPQTAAPAAALPTAGNAYVTWGAGILGAILMALAALLWLEPDLFSRRLKETAPSADEFEIESASS